VTTNTSDAAARATAPPVELTVAAGYFALQAVVGALLWIGADVSGTVRSWLELVADRPVVTNGFRTADMVVIASSTLAAWALWRGRSWAMAPVWFTVGGIVYPTLYLVGWTTSAEGTGDVAVAMMLLATLLCGVAAVLAWRSTREH
jgi:hypothetical protein